MEETVQVLLDEGALARNGHIRITKPLRELKIPPTVQAILAARSTVYRRFRKIC